MKLRITQAERKWLERAIAKKADLFDDLEPKQLKLVEREARAWQNMYATIGMEEMPNEGESSDFKVSRTDLRLLQVLVLERLAFITGKTIPAYEDRIRKFPDKAEGYREYLDAAIELRTGLMSLSKKIGDAL
jgi:hypothetical protein